MRSWYVCISFVLFVLSRISQALQYLTSTAYGSNSCNPDTQISTQKCHILEQCFDLGPGFWGDHLYGIYVYAPSKDLGVQTDDTVSTNIYAMATYTNPECTVKNIMKPMAIISSPCASSSCCETTTVADSNTSISYMILESVPQCPSDDVINGDIEKEKESSMESASESSASANANGTPFSDLQILATVCIFYMIWRHVHERKRADGGSEYTSVDNDDETIEVQLPSVRDISVDLMFKTTYTNNYQQIE